MPTFPAGWYRDYADHRQQRFYDGEHWTNDVYMPDGPDGKRRRPKVRPSRQLVEAAYAMLVADRAMLGVLFVGSVLASLVGGGVLALALTWRHFQPGWTGGEFGGAVVVAVAIGAASFVMQLVCGAVVAAALLRAQGGRATVREALAMAWSRRRQLLAWAFVSAVVGAVMRALERFGASGIIAALTVNIGWSFATIFATPVIMVEGTMPIATVRRSAGILRRHFAVNLITTVSLAALWTALSVGAVAVAAVGGLVWLTEGTTGAVIGIPMIVIAVLALVFVATVSSALSAYLRTLIYRYAEGHEIPGVDRIWMPQRLSS